MPFKILNLPIAKLKIYKTDKQYFVWCLIRKKKLILTPEEWVRQHWIHYLIEIKKIPVGLIASEIEIEIEGTKRRCDILVYDKNLSISLLIECKSTDIMLSSSTINQIIQYNNVIKAPIIGISNGLDHHFIKIDYQNNTFEKITDF